MNWAPFSEGLVLAAAIAGCGSRTGLISGPILEADSGEAASDGGPLGASADAASDACIPVQGAAPVVLASGMHISPGLVVDSTSVYFGFGDPLPNGLAKFGGILKMPVGGGAVSTLATSHLPIAVAADNANLYWVTTDDTVYSDCSVMKVPLGGGTPVTLASQNKGCNGIAVDATSAYWTVGGAPGALLKLPLAGGKPSTVDTTDRVPSGVATYKGDLYWLTYYGTSAIGTVMAAPGGGGTPRTLAGMQNGAIAIAVDSQSVYWTSANGGGAVSKVSRFGGEPVTLASSCLPQSISVDDENVYWTSPSAGTVMKIPRGGGAPVTLAACQDRPWDIAVDATSVYWTNIGSDAFHGVVMRTPK